MKCDLKLDVTNTLFLASFLNAFLVLPLIVSSSISWAQELSRTEVISIAHQKIQEDPSWRLLAGPSELSWTHPSVRVHGDYYTVIYHQSYFEKYNQNNRREWEVIGGDIRFHYNSYNKKSSLQKNIIPWGRLQINSENLFSEKQIPKVLKKYFHLSTNSEELNLKIKYRLWANPKSDVTSQNILTPVYMVQISKLDMQSSEKVKLHKSARVALISAENGQVLVSYPLSWHANQYSIDDSKVPRILVRDGRANTVQTKKFGDTDDLSARGGVLEKYKSYCQLISSKKGSEGSPLIINPTQCTLTFDGSTFSSKADDSSKRAHQNATQVIKYFGQNYNQWGIDFSPTENKSSTPIVNIVHIGKDFDNAYWDEELKIMVYGDGNPRYGKTATHDYTLALDIAGHEFTHALVSGSANFAADDEPGALNEAFADIFGILIERSQEPNAHWDIGQRLYDNQDGDSDEVALRSLSKPSKFKTSVIENGKTLMVPFPEKYSEKLANGQKCTEENDQCEIHANSTIWSHGAYLINQYFQNELKMNSSEADQKLGLLYFLTLTHNLHENETIKSAAEQLTKKCTEVLKENECQFVQKAMSEILK